MKAHIFYFFLGFVCLLSSGLSVATYQRNQLVWDRVMADGTPNKVAGWDANGDAAEITPIDPSNFVDLTSNQTINGTKRFNPGGGQAGIGVGQVASDPGSGVQGDMWVNSTSNSLKVLLNSTNRTLVNFTSTLPVDYVPFSTGANGTVTGEAEFTYNSTTNTLTSARVVTVPTTNVAGLNVGTLSGDPAAPVNGDVWLNTATQSLKGRVNGASVPLNTIKYSASVGAFDFPNTAAGAQSSLAIAGITGAVVGDPAIIGYPTVPPTNGVYYAYISAANTVTVVFTNTSTAAIDPANQNFNIIVFNR